VPNWSSMSCDLGIFVISPSSRSRRRRRRSGCDEGGGSSLSGAACCVLQGAVGAVLVEMRCVLGQYVFEVASVDDQYLVEQLSA
jgi:hypothetical protein